MEEQIRGREIKEHEAVEKGQGRNMRDEKWKRKIETDEKKEKERKQSKQVKEIKGEEGRAKEQLKRKKRRSD